MKAYRPSFAYALPITLLLATLVSVPGWADPMAFVGAGPRTGTKVETPFADEYAKPMALLWVGPRYGLGGNSPLGEEQKENFQMYDVAAHLRLPWGWRHRPSDWTFETRLIASAGQLVAAGTSGLMATVVPALAVSSPNGLLSVDAGPGLAFFTNHKFGVQNFGGPAQIIGTAGIGLDPFPMFHAGYRFQHFSDAGVYGPTSLGVDLHIIELGYRF
ncbi:MAG: acyloxyacyl hydrolase [Nitrospirota bacterium]